MATGFTIFLFLMQANVSPNTQGLRASERHKVQHYGWPAFIGVLFLLAWFTKEEYDEPYHDGTLPH